MSVPSYNLFSTNRNFTQSFLSRSYGIWLDILAEEETFRRLTILPDKVPDEAKTILRSQYPTGLEELDSKSANEILVSSKNFKVALASVFHFIYFLRHSSGEVVPERLRAEQDRPAGPGPAEQGQGLLGISCDSFDQASRKSNGEKIMF